MFKKSILFLVLTMFIINFRTDISQLFANDTVSIEKVGDWGYQLQGYEDDMQPVIDSKFDLIVMDYSLSGGAEDEFTGSDIEKLRTSAPCEQKIILSYLSIGEAEEFRFYFDDMPTDLLFDEPNPQFPDNIKVRFWEKAWQDIIFGNAEEGENKSYLDRIIDAGFDGVYLDIIDAYEFWGSDDIGGNGERDTAAKEMVEFVIAIADYARKVRGKSGFIVVPQNGAGIIDADAYSFADNPDLEAEIQKERYFANIDAIGAEDSFFFGIKENNNSLNIQTDTIDLLNIFRDAGKPVLSVDYVQSEEKVKMYYELALKEGYIPYATIRDLDILTINDMFEPVCNDLSVNETPVTSSTPTPTLTPSTTPDSEPTVSPTPFVTPTPVDTKLFTFSCEHEFETGFRDIDKLVLEPGQTESCTLSLADRESGIVLEIATNIRSGIKSEVEITPLIGETDINGELQFTITAIDKGIDWLAWAVKNSEGKFEFNKHAYDAGLAWGMLVRIK